MKEKKNIEWHAFLTVLSPFHPSFFSSSESNSYVCLETATFPPQGLPEGEKDSAHDE